LLPVPEKTDTLPVAPAATTYDDASISTLKLWLPTVVLNGNEQRLDVQLALAAAAAVESIQRWALYDPAGIYCGFLRSKLDALGSEETTMVPVADDESDVVEGVEVTGADVAGASAAGGLEPPPPQAASCAAVNRNGARRMALFT
jgi:hypothetical protein